MLFNSPVFLFAFLPIVLLGYYGLGRWNARAAAGWLTVSSFVFYGWWNPAFLIILSGSILFNFTVSVVLRASSDRARQRNLVLAFGVATDLLVLFYYKYLSYVIGVVASLGLTSSAPPSRTVATTTKPHSPSPTTSTTPAGLDTRPAVGMPCGPEGTTATSNSGAPVVCLNTPGGSAWEPPGG